MPRSHWLDPLARRVLQATGQLPAPPKPALPQPEPIAPEPPAWVMDVNRASRDQWLQLPGCNQDTADLLVRLQRGGVQFASADDLFRLLELPNDLARLWTPHLLFNGTAMSHRSRRPLPSTSTTPAPISWRCWAGRNNGWPT